MSDDKINRLNSKLCVRINTKKNIKYKRSQAALEFLVTYGWALLAVLVAVGVLIYFGVFNTSRYVDDSCNFGKQIVCEDFILSSNGNVSLKLRNNFGVPIDIKNITIKSPYNTSRICYPTLLVKPSPINITQYSSVNITCNIGTASLLSTEKINMRMTIDFRRSGSVNNPSHNQSGEMFFTVQ